MKTVDRSAAADLLAYERYLADPTLRERIDAEVRHLRAQAVDRYIAMPAAALLACAGRVFGSRESGSHQPRRTPWIQQL